MGGASACYLGGMEDFSSATKFKVVGFDASGRATQIRWSKPKGGLSRFIAMHRCWRLGAALDVL